MATTHQLEWKDTTLRIRGLTSGLLTCQFTERRDVGQRAFGVEEPTHTAVEEALGNQAQHDIAESGLEGARTK